MLTFIQRILVALRLIIQISFVSLPSIVDEEALPVLSQAQRAELERRLDAVMVDVTALGLSGTAITVQWTVGYLHYPLPNFQAYLA